MRGRNIERAREREESLGERGGDMERPRDRGGNMEGGQRQTDIHTDTDRQANRHLIYRQREKGI